MKSPRYTLKEFRRDFPNDDVCLERVFQLRFPYLKCKGCGREKCFYRVKKRKCFACSFCGWQIRPLAGTIFHKSSTPLTDWFHALFLFSCSKNGVAATELQRQLGVTYKCAWRMCRQIRLLMEASNQPFSGTIEVDEMYVGGQAKYMHRKKLAIEGQPVKTIVVGVLDRKGKVATGIVDYARMEYVLPFVSKLVERGSTIYTDDSVIYHLLPKMGYKHDTTDHGHRKYVKGKVHSNSIENFWSQVKRSLSGTHHAVSSKHLPLYVSEFAYRYSNRESSVPLFHLLLARA